MHLEVNFTSSVGASSSYTSVVFNSLGGEKLFKGLFEGSDPVFTSQRLSS
jgi:hypothetical protein